MRINALLRVLAAALLLAALPFAYATADPASEPGSGNSNTVSQPPVETPTTQPGKTPAEGGDNKTEPFIPSESISADSAVSFPVDI